MIINLLGCALLSLTVFSWTTCAHLKCICNENFDFVIFALSDNFIFSDHFTLSGIFFYF